MDIFTYDCVLEGLKRHNKKAKQNYGNSVVSYAPKEPTFPLTVLSEIRNVANPLHNTCYERVASVGYSVRIYAQTKGNKNKQTIARVCAQIADEYMSGIGLLRISYNYNESVNEDGLAEIVMTYSGNLHENRRKFI